MGENPRSVQQSFWGETYREGVGAVDGGDRCGRSSSPEVRFVAGDDGDGGAGAVRLRQHVHERGGEGGNGTEGCVAVGNVP